MFVISPPNIQFLKREVIHATRLRGARQTGTFRTCSTISSHSVMKIKILLPGNYSKHHVVYIQNGNVFIFFHIQGLYIFASTLLDFRRSARLA
jgi:hypothetical protein